VLEYGSGNSVVLGVLAHGMMADVIVCSNSRLDRRVYFTMFRGAVPSDPRNDDDWT